MASSRIVLRGIRASGRHGANPGEQLEEQELVIDLDLTVEVRGDEIDATTDYRRVAEVARSVVTDRSFQLLETIAEEVARAVSAMAGVERCTATVHKPRAAGSLGLDDVTAESTVV
jgi:dihydroneopterin aldolase